MNSKIWQNSDKSSDKIIAVHNNIIYNGNPKPEEIDNVILSLKSNEQSSKLFSMPISYIKSIEMNESNNFIEIIFGKDSNQHLKISNPEIKNEIFNYFKDNLPNTVYKFKKENSFKAIAGLVVAIIFYLWTVSVASDIEKGFEFEIHGNKAGVATIVLMIAQLGTIKVSLIFGSIILVTCIAIFKKESKPANIHTISILR